MKNALNKPVLLIFIIIALTRCQMSDNALKEELEGKAFGNWKTVMVQFQMNGRYEAFLKASEAYWDKHSMGQGTWFVKSGKITLSPNDSQDEKVRRVEGIYTYDGDAIESNTHRLHR